MAEKTLFQRIADREIPADIVYEDEFCVAFRDISPQAPTHILVVPRRAVATLDDLEDDDVEMMGRLMLAAREVAQQAGLTRGWRVVINCGPDAQQSVQHIHLHLLGGRRMSWPPG